MWPTLFLSMSISMNNRKLLWPEVIGFFSVVIDEHVEFEK
jgi:hypothetical protein